MRVAIVTESFLPVINGVSNSVVRLLEHLLRNGHQPLVVAPGAGPDHHGGAPVVRIPALDLPMVDSVPVGVPTRKVVTALQELPSGSGSSGVPGDRGARGMWAARRLGLPTMAVYQTDVAGFADSDGLGFAARTAWRWTRRCTAAPTAPSPRPAQR